MLTCQRGTLGTVPTFLLPSPRHVSWQWLPSCLQPLAGPQTAHSSHHEVQSQHEEGHSVYALGEGKESEENVLSKLAVSWTDQLVDRWTGRQSIDRYGQRWTHGQSNTWTVMDGQHIDKDGQIDNAPSIPKFPPRGVILHEVTTATDAC